MGATDHKNDTAEGIQKEGLLVEQIYQKLNQGNLFEIYQIVESLEDYEVRCKVEKIFREKYHFDFKDYI